MTCHELVEEMSKIVNSPSFDRIREPLTATEIMRRRDEAIRAERATISIPPGYAVINGVHVHFNDKGEIIMSEAINGAGVNECGGSLQPAARKRYVRHISGKGEKWEVVEEVPRDIFPCRLSPHEWCVRGKRHEPMSSNTFHFLPKSEYELVPPVKQWVDVTKDCRECERDILHKIDGKDYCVIDMNGLAKPGYRFVKKQVNNFKTLLGAYTPLTERFDVFIIEHEEEVPLGV